MESKYTDGSRNSRPHAEEDALNRSAPGPKKRATTDHPFDFIPSVPGHTRQRRRDREQPSQEITNRDARPQPTPGAEARRNDTWTNEPITTSDRRSASVTKNSRRKREHLAPRPPPRERENAARRSTTEPNAKGHTTRKDDRSDRKEHPYRRKDPGDQGASHQRKRAPASRLRR